MTSVGDKLTDDEFFGDVVDAPKEGTEQHKKQEELKYQRQGKVRA